MREVALGESDQAVEEVSLARGSGIAADNDGEANTGWIAAGKARIVGAIYRTAPDFGDSEKGDWNDFCVLHGKEQTMEGLYGA